MQSRRQFLTNSAGGMSVLLLAACSPTTVLETGDKSIASKKPSEKARLNVTAAMTKINKIRARHGLRRISVDSRLMKAARTHARTMAKHGRMGHAFGPETRFLRRIKAVGFEGSAGENLGISYRSVDAVIAGWMNSPPHRKIMLKRNFNLGGIGLAHKPAGSNNRENYWVLILGSGGGGRLNSIG